MAIINLSNIGAVSPLPSGQIGQILVHNGEAWVATESGVITLTSGTFIDGLTVTEGGITFSDGTTIYSGDIVGVTTSGVTLTQLTTTSGDIVDQIPSLAGYATETWVNTNYIDISEMTTISGDIVDQIATISGASESWVNNNFIDITEITTISGDVIAQIPSLSGYATELWVTTVSGDIVDQIPSLAGYATETWVNTNYIDISEMTTISGDLVAQMGDSGLSSVVINGIAGESLDKNQAVSVSGGLLWVADYDDTSNLADTIGLVTDTVASGGAAQVLNFGIAEDVGWSWSPGSELFLGSSGAIVDTQPTDNYIKPVGIAVTASSVLVNINTGWHPGSGTVGGTGGGDVTLEQLTTTSGDIMDQMPDLSPYATTSDLVSTSGSLHGQILPKLSNVYIDGVVEDPTIPPYTPVRVGTNGNLQKCHTYTSEGSNCIGITTQTGIGGQSCQVLHFGFIENGDWSWSPGADLFVSNNGITETMSSGIVKPIGNAVTSSGILVNIALGWEVTAGGTLDFADYLPDAQDKALLVGVGDAWVVTTSGIFSAASGIINYITNVTQITFTDGSVLAGVGTFRITTQNIYLVDTSYTEYHRYDMQTEVDVAQSYATQNGDVWTNPSSYEDLTVTNLATSKYIQDTKGPIQYWVKAATRDGYLEGGDFSITAIQSALGGAAVDITVNSDHYFSEGDTLYINGTTDYDGVHELPSQGSLDTNIFRLNTAFSSSGFSSAYARKRFEIGLGGDHPYIHPGYTIELSGGAMAKITAVSGSPAVHVLLDEDLSSSTVGGIYPHRFVATGDYTTVVSGAGQPRSYIPQPEFNTYSGNFFHWNHDCGIGWGDAFVAFGYPSQWGYFPFYGTKKGIQWDCDTAWYGHDNSLYASHGITNWDYHYMKCFYYGLWPDPEDDIPVYDAKTCYVANRLNLSSTGSIKISTGFLELGKSSLRRFDPLFNELGRCVNKVRIRGRNVDSIIPARDTNSPKSFNVYGSNISSASVRGSIGDWTLLATFTDVERLASKEWGEYAFFNGTVYQHYMLEITEEWDPSLYLELGWVEFVNAPNARPEVPFAMVVDDPISLEDTEALSIVKYIVPFFSWETTYPIRITDENNAGLALISLDGKNTWKSCIGVGGGSYQYDDVVRYSGGSWQYKNAGGSWTDMDPEFQDMLSAINAAATVTSNFYFDWDSQYAAGSQFQSLDLEGATEAYIAVVRYIELEDHYGFYNNMPEDTGSYAYDAGNFAGLDVRKRKQQGIILVFEPWESEYDERTSAYGAVEISSASAGPISVGTVTTPSDSYDLDSSEKVDILDVGSNITQWVQESEEYGHFKDAASGIVAVGSGSITASGYPQNPWVEPGVRVQFDDGYRFIVDVQSPGSGIDAVQLDTPHTTSGVQSIDFLRFDSELANYNVYPSGVYPEKVHTSMTTASSCAFTSDWDYISTITVDTVVSGSPELYHALSFDNFESWKVYYSDAWRTIVSGSGGAWYYRNNAADWMPASGNGNSLWALSQAMEYPNNQMGTSVLQSLDKLDYLATGGFTPATFSSLGTSVVNFAVGVQATVSGDYAELVGYTVSGSRTVGDNIDFMFSTDGGSTWVDINNLTVSEEAGNYYIKGVVTDTTMSGNSVVFKVTTSGNSEMFFTGASTGLDKLSDEDLAIRITTVSGDLYQLIKEGIGTTGSGNFNSSTGYSIPHNLGDEDHFTMITLGGTGIPTAITGVGYTYVHFGLNEDVVWNTAGPEVDGVPFKWRVSPTLN